jgi:hypothetical protein
MVIEPNADGRKSAIRSNTFGGEWERNAGRPHATNLATNFVRFGGH